MFLLGTDWALHRIDMEGYFEKYCVSTLKSENI